MANYSIPRARDAGSGGGDVTVTEATVNQTHAVSLVGQNYTGYGDEIATNFLQMLENFASDTPPQSNTRIQGGGTTPLTGQLWYDTTAANPVLKVYDGSDWQAQSKTEVGTTESSTLRWNNTNKRWQPEERVRVSDAGSLLIANDATGTNALTLNHGGTNLTATFAGTTDFTLSGLTGDLTVTGGRGLSVENGSTALAIRAGASNDINFTTANANTFNLPAGVKLITAAATTTRAGIQIPEMSGTPSAPVDGDIWVTAAGNFYARLNGATVDLAAAAGGTVTSSGSPLADEVAVFTSGTNIDSDSTFTWDGTTMFATNVTGTNIGGITSSDLLDKSQNSEVISGTNWDFSGISNSSGQIAATSGTTLRILSTDNTDWVDFSHGSGASDGNFDIVGTATVNLNISGFTGNVISSRPVHATSGGADAFRVIGDASTWATADSYISFYDSDSGEHGLQIGTTAADSTKSRINARLGQLELYASNTVVCNMQPSLTTWTSNTVTSLELRNSFTSGNTTSAAVSDNNGTLFNVGYNETPLCDDVGVNIDTGSFTLSNLCIGKMISRTVGTSRTLTIDNVASIPVGATVLVHNGSSGGTFTIAIGTITNLDWIDGSGTLPTRTSNRTLDNNSIATLRKVNSTTWQIWGNGIS
jgi:hypothetical protein